MKRFFVISLTILQFWSCSKNKPFNKFADPVVVRIADYQDRRLPDSLSGFLQSENPVYRAAAALAFASIQDTIAASRLGNLLLEDPDVSVRSSAAFALGQTGGFAAVNALIPAAHDPEAGVVREVLEALGKTIGRMDLEILKNFLAEDSVRQEGLSWAYYRLGLRNLTDSIIIAREVEFLSPKYSHATRLAAAHFFGRTRLSGIAFPEKLIDAALHDPSSDVRMAVVGGLKKIEVHRAMEVLRQIVRTDKDYRVRTNAVKACGGFSLNESAEIVFGALRDSSIAVQIAASELLITLIRERPFKRIEEDIAACSNTRVKADLYAALLNSIPYDNAVKEIIAGFAKTDTYGKAALLNALGYARGPHEAAAIGFISSELLNSNLPAIQSAAALALVAFNTHPGFNEKKKNQYVELYRKAIQRGDPAVVGILSGALGDSTFRYRETVKDFSFLYEAKKRLHMPKDIESLQPLVDAIAYFEKKQKPPSLKNEFNHALDWELVKSIASDQCVRIKTNRGDIRLRLFVDEAPGSVGNFVGLINRKYFDGKKFHRVVPNFVVQTGCNRGDGFGSEDYSLRSEFSRRRYATGSVGMASAGKDTEGTQWFITHSATPHLDGRYTVFASVEKGMETVDQIEVGDSIISVSLEKN